jgi:ribonuclease R
VSKKKQNGSFADPALETEILKIFKSSPSRLMNYKQVAALLEERDKKKVSEVLDALLKRELIGELSPGKYHYLNPVSRVEGKVEITSRGSGFLIADNMDEDVFISPADLNHAFHGDRVLVQLYARRKGKRLEGEVLEILHRSKTRFVGIIEKAKNFSFCLPDDKRMYADIFIPADSLNGAENGQKVLVEITDWPAKAKNPFGKVIEVLGDQGENNAEMHAIVAEFGFPLSFSGAALAEADKIPVKVPASEIKKRRDFRETTTFTIDPADAKDFDDAISIRLLEEGIYEIGVHIADVSHYVRPGGGIDVEAYERGTSVYLVDRTIPMLPEKLSNGVCSLRPQEEKLTFSAVFHMNLQGNVLKEWFGKTLIHSDRRFTYEEAQEILEKGEGEYAGDLRVLNTIARQLKEARFRNGAISFETEEVKFLLDENGRPVELYKKVRKDAHKLVEEFMLLANRRVAEFVFKMNGKGKDEKKLSHPFVYRVHESPNTEKLTEFVLFIKRFGYQIKTGSDRQVADSMNALLDKVEGRPEQHILQSMAIRTMAKATYTIKQMGHYGLAFDHYAHFTSPIRRYPDLMVHRLLEKYLSGEKIKEQESVLLEKQCRHSSEMEQKAAEAERASVKYKQAEYLQQFIGRVFDGIISGVTDWGIYVELIENKCEGLLRLNTIFDDFYEFDEKTKAVVGKRYKKRFMIGDAIKVQVKKTDPVKRTIDLAYVKK